MLIVRQARSAAQRRCPCATGHDGQEGHDGTGRYVFLGPDGGHHRNSNYSRRVFRPACDGRHPPTNGKPGRLVITDATAWPGIPVASWPAAVPGTPFSPPSGRGTPRLVNAKGTGRCPDCGHAVSLRLDGKTIAHNISTGTVTVQHCPGSVDAHLKLRDRRHVLIATSAERGIGELASKLEASQQDGSYIAPGLDAGPGEVLSDSLGIIDHARKISIGATIMTAVAALESLLVDLAPESESRRRGLHPLLQDFLRRHVVPEPTRTEITETGNNVRDRRNTFARSLIASYWETDASIAVLFTPESMEDTLYTVTRIAVLMEGIVLA